MLYLDSPAIMRGITLFRDYNNTALFYFAPNSPRLTVEAGQPMFQLLASLPLALSGGKRTIRQAPAGEGSPRA